MKSLAGLWMWMTAGVASGATLVTTLAVTQPNSLKEIGDNMPNVETSSLALIMAVFTYVLKNSSDKNATTSKDTLMDRLEALAFESRGNAREITAAANHVEVRLSSQLAAIGATVVEIKDRQDDTWNKVDAVGNRVTRIETIFDGRTWK